MKYKCVTRKFLSLLLAGSMFASVLTGCGDNKQSVKDGTKVSTEDSNVGTEDSAINNEFDPRTITEGVKLTIAVPEQARIADWNEISITKKIEETLGVDLEFMVLPSADYGDKLNVMVMAGDELPDMIWDVGGYIQSWANEGALVELTEFYENPDLAKNINKVEEITGVKMKDVLGDANGHIYAVGKSSIDEFAGYRSLWMYEPWLQELGLEIPKTTEDYYKVCKAICEADCNGNGKKDEIAITGNGLNEWFNFLMSAFVYAHDSNYMFLENGKIGYAYTTEEWKEGLKYIRRFFEEGLIPTDILTQDWDQWRTQMFDEGPVAFSFVWFYYDGANTEIGKNYHGITALEGPDGVSRVQSGIEDTQVGALITTDCENPEAAFLVCDFMSSEEIAISQRFGERGVNWDFWDEADVEDKALYSRNDGKDGEISFIAYDDASYWGDSAPQTAGYLQHGPFIIWSELYSSRAAINDGSNPINDEYNALKNEMKANQVDEVINYIPMTQEEKDEIADVKTTLSTVVKEYTSAFLAGTKDIDSEWDEFQNEIEKIGYQKVLDAYQTAYNRMQ